MIHIFFSIYEHFLLKGMTLTHLLVMHFDFSIKDLKFYG